MTSPPEDPGTPPRDDDDDKDAGGASIRPRLEGAGGEGERAVPRRTLVCSPRTAWTVSVPGASRSGGAADDATGPRPSGDPVRLLIRAQLRSALCTCGVVLIVIVVLPLLPIVAPWLSRAGPHGIPLPWMWLVFAAQPVWVALAFRHVHRGERIERMFTVRPHDPGRPQGARPALPRPRPPADPPAGTSSRQVDGP
jgi:hypothetical protein